MNLDDFEFLPEPESVQQPTTDTGWVVLSVEDNPAYQQSLVFALSDMRFRDKPITLITANSRQAAATLISQRSDINVILLDVVMEEDDSGLRLVNTIREVFGNKTVRIVLLTGQPGVAPRLDVMQSYDIDDYWLKSKMNKDSLQTVLFSNLRTWHHLNMLEEAKKGLQLIISASQHLDSKRSLPDFADHVLATLANLIGAAKGGIVCTIQAEGQTPFAETVLAASGHFESLRDTKSRGFTEQIAQLITRAMESHSHVFEDDINVLYFANPSVTDTAYICVADAAESLNEQQIYLMQVFSENVQTNFTNIALFNRLSELAYKDPVLGIFNLNRLHRELQVIDAEQWDESQLIACCIDEYASMQLTFGSQFMHKFLLAVYQFLTDLLPDSYMQAKIADDKIVFITEHPVDVDYLRHHASHPIRVDGVEHRLPLRFSTVALNLTDKHNSELLISTALHTIELARSKKVGALTCTVNPEEEAARRVHDINRLTCTIAQNLFQIHLQPKIDLVDKTLVGFEALARWQTKEGDFIPPDKFIHLAEQAGLIGQVDSCIAELAAQALETLQQHGIHLPIAINLSVLDFDDEFYLDRILQKFTRRSLDTGLVEIEITESAAMEHYHQLHSQLIDAIERGFKVAIDDFGTGYSSLSHITELPATSLKIDRSFVSNLGVEQKAGHVVDMILRLSQRFGFTVVAEGIESDAQAELLRKAGCQVGQGYLFAKPMPLNDVIAWVRSGAYGISAAYKG